MGEPRVTLDETTRNVVFAVGELLPDGLVWVGPGGVVEYVNHVAERIADVSAPDIVGRDVREALPLADVDGRSWWELTDPWHGLASRTGHREKLLTLPNGRELLVTARYLRSGRGEAVRGILLGFRDSLARQRAEADQAALITATAHELRSPLTGVKGFTSALLRNWERFSDEQKRFMLETVEADADRLARLVTDVLDVSRLDSGRLVVRPQPVQVGEALARHVERMRSTATAPDLVLDVPPDLPAVLVDPDRFDQIIGNLLDNAVRHGRGRVRLSGSMVESDGGRFVDMTVDDAGDGIPVEQRNVVFSRFWLSAASTGSGLGLYLVRGMAKAHGGTALVEEGPAGGALVRVRLPAVS